MIRLPAFALFLSAILVASCERDKSSMAEKSRKEIMVKHNFRVAEQDGYKVEVWTLGAIGWPIIPGCRVYVPNADMQTPPETVVSLLLKKDGAPGDTREVSVQPILKKTAIEGGYWESIRAEDGKYIERKEKYVGKNGIWETNLDDPFKSDPRKPGATPVPPGKYTLSINVSIKGGPEFKFDRLPYQLVRGR